MIVHDEAYITLHDHYTNGVECVGPENVENKEENCEAGDCLDKICGKTIEFPTGVYQYTTICHQCTPLFSKSSEFSESNFQSHLNFLNHSNSLSRMYFQNWITLLVRWKFHLLMMIQVLKHLNLKLLMIQENKDQKKKERIR